MKKRTADGLCLLILVGVILISTVTMWQVSGTLLDGDASAEMVLAEHLSKTNRILSKDWFYSTELRVANTQLVYALLFKLFNSWRLVRFVGSMLLQGMYALSYVFFARQAGIGKRGICLSTAMLLFPVSISYGRIVLYHNYYIFHLMFGFLMMGLLISIDRHAVDPKRRYQNALRIALLMILSLISGMGGIRQAFLTQIPMAAVVLLYWLKCDLAAEARGEKSTFSAVRRVFFCAFGACVCFGIGLLINKRVLLPNYSVLDFTEMKVRVLSASKLEDLVYGFFHLFGFRKETSAFSLSGILSIFSIPAGVYSLYMGVVGLFSRKEPKGFGQFAAEVFFPASLAVMLCIFLFSSLQFEFIRYMIPCVVWIAPMLAMRGRVENGKVYARNILCIGIVALMALSGLGNVKYVMSGHRSGQIYEGLTGSYRNANQVKQMRPAVEFVREGGYTHAYACVGYSNLFTEMADGRVKMVSIVENPETGEMSYYDWLSVKEYRKETPPQDLLLLTPSHEKNFLNMTISESFRKVYGDQYASVYVCDEGGTMKTYLDAQPTLTQQLGD